MANNNNGSKSLLDFDCLGWDLDHTLIRYNLKELYPFLYEIFRKYLIEKVGYSKDLLQFPLDYDFVKKGIVNDKDKGNFLHIDYKFKIIKGYHGTKLLTEEELIKEYGENKFLDLSNHKRFWTFITYFEAPLSYLLAKVIDLEDQFQTHQEDFNIYNRDYSAHTQVLFNAFEYNFAQWNKGFYFPTFSKNPGKYILPQPKVGQWLIDLRQTHKKYLFLLTNSLPEYTNLLMKYSFGSNWTSLFDLISVNARKPGFFTQDLNYYEFTLVPNENNDYPGPSCPLSNPITSFRKDYPFHSNGCATQFVSNLKTLLHANNVTICYFGDHLRSDVYAAKNSAGWTVVGIVEELEDIELEQKFRCKFETSPPSFPTNANHPSSNPYWGSFFTSMDGRQLTFLGYLILTEANLSIPSLDRLAGLPLNWSFNKIQNEGTVDISTVWQMK